MQYRDMLRGRFVRRLNRFVARVEIEGVEAEAHIRNTGRLAEVFAPGCELMLLPSENSARRTKYDVVAALRRMPDGAERWVGVDSMLPNAAAGAWLRAGGLGALSEIRAEARVGESRFDFVAREGERRVAIEVKGCTLEEAGVARFPDAPTARGLRHVRELTALCRAGWRCALVIAIQFPGAKRFEPNWALQREFGEALIEACAAGVAILAFECALGPEGPRLESPVPVSLERPGARG